MSANSSLRTFTRMLWTGRSKSRHVISRFVSSDFHSVWVKVNFSVLFRFGKIRSENNFFLSALLAGVRVSRTLHVVSRCPGG